MNTGDASRNKEGKRQKQWAETTLSKVRVNRVGLFDRGVPPEMIAQRDSLQVSETEFNQKEIFAPRVHCEPRRSQFAIFVAASAQISVS